MYSAVDLVVAPSLQENSANTVMEAPACDSQCVAYNIGRLPDMIEHRQTPYLATPF
ncbi:glycosyltransferase [Thermodesulfobacteriota bacterium]